MIKTLFWDLDECLLHSTTSSWEKGWDHEFRLPDDPHTYRTWARLGALDLVEFSRNLLGIENVCVLTTSTLDYATKLNELLGFNFTPDRIFARCTIRNKVYRNTAWGGGQPAKHPLAHPMNVLIDNLEPRDNLEKILLMGIEEDRYFRVPYFYANHPHTQKENTKIRNWILRLHESPTTPEDIDCSGFLVKGRDYDFAPD